MRSALEFDDFACGAVEADFGALDAVAELVELVADELGAPDAELPTLSRPSVQAPKTRRLRRFWTNLRWRLIPW